MWHAIAEIINGIGKWLTHSKRMEEKQDRILDNQQSLERRVLRLEIIAAINRKDKSTVYHLYDEYKNNYNGNSYMDALVKEFFKGKKSK